MITGIPNQPIDFVGDDLIKCTAENEPPLVIGATDDLIFQFQLGRCDDAVEYFDYPGFNDEWLTGGTWSIRLNNACAVAGQAGASIEYDSWVTTAGVTYEVEVVVRSIEGSGVTVSIGGVDTIIEAAGTHTFMVTALDASAFSIILIDDTSAVCLYSAQVYEAATDVEIALIAEGDVELYSTTVDLSPQFFTISGTTVTAIIPMDETEAEGCFKVFIVDPCDAENTLCSQTIKLEQDCDGTVKIRVCNDYDQPEMGFVAGRFEMRLPLLKILPTWSYDVSEERLTNGKINRQRIDRQTAYELRVNDTIGYAAHRFVSAITMFDHFYIGEREYSVDVETYEPAYPDSANAIGAVKLTIRPKQELFRKVNCEPEGEGCNPANDPICNTPNITFVGEFTGYGLYEYTVTLSSMVGFPTGDMILTIDGETQDPIELSSAPFTFGLGPFNPGTVIGVVVTNTDNAECNWETTLNVPCECSAGALIMRLKSTPAPSVYFTAADGVDAVRDGCVNDNPAWTIAGGVGGGGVNVIDNGGYWYIYDTDGVGFMSQPGENFRLPCDVTAWYYTTDGTTPLVERDIFVCGGGDENCDECCSEGDLQVDITSMPTWGAWASSQAMTSGSTVNGRPSWNGSLGKVVVWTGDNWYGADSNGFGFMSTFGLDVTLPCEVTEWYYTEDGINAEDLLDMTVCGGA